jgi:hypothetical protein
VGKSGERFFVKAVSNLFEKSFGYFLGGVSWRFINFGSLPLRVEQKRCLRAVSGSGVSLAI